MSIFDEPSESPDYSKNRFKDLHEGSNIVGSPFTVVEKYLDTVVVSCPHNHRKTLRSVDLKRKHVCKACSADTAEKPLSGLQRKRQANAQQRYLTTLLTRLDQEPGHYVLPKLVVDELLKCSVAGHKEYTRTLVDLTKTDYDPLTEQQQCQVLESTIKLSRDNFEEIGGKIEAVEKGLATALEEVFDALKVIVLEIPSLDHQIERGLRLRRQTLTEVKKKDYRELLEKVTKKIIAAPLLSKTKKDPEMAGTYARGRTEEVKRLLVELYGEGAKLSHLNELVEDFKGSAKGALEDSTLAEDLKSLTSQTFNTGNLK